MEPLISAAVTLLLLMAEAESFCRGEVFGDHIGLFPRGKSPRCQITQEVLRDLSKVRFVTDSILFRNKNFPSIAGGSEFNSRITGSEFGNCGSESFLKARLGTF